MGCWLCCQGEAYLSAPPVVRCVVFAQNWLPQDEGFWAECLIAVQGKQRGTAHCLRCVSLALQDAHGRGSGVIFGANGDHDAVLELKNEVRARKGAAVNLRGVV